MWDPAWVHLFLNTIWTLLTPVATESENQLWSSAELCLVLEIDKGY